LHNSNDVCLFIVKVLICLLLPFKIAVNSVKLGIPHLLCWLQGIESHWKWKWRSRRTRFTT